MPALPDSSRRSPIVQRDVDALVAASLTVCGWREGEALAELARTSCSLGPDAILVEVGVFMGRTTSLLAGARRACGTGRVHCVDPFDCSGEPFSVPHYMRELQATGARSLEEAFTENMARLALRPWIEIHKGLSRDVGSRWSLSIDLLLLDGDQSELGAREAYETWIRFLKPGGTIVLGNVHDKPSEGHDGNSRLAAEELKPPRYSRVRRIGATTFAVKED